MLDCNHFIKASVEYSSRFGDKADTIVLKDGAAIDAIIKILQSLDCMDSDYIDYAVKDGINVILAYRVRGD